MSMGVWASNGVIRLGWCAPKFDRSIASVRIRCLQVMEKLKTSGFIAEQYDPERSAEYRCVVFSKAYEAEDIALAERLKQQHVRVLFDICDDHAYGAERDHKINERASRLRKMLCTADIVVTSTPALADSLVSRYEFLRNQVVVISDSLDSVMSQDSARAMPSGVKGWVDLMRLRYFLRTNEGKRRLVWFGNHGVGHAASGMVDLQRVRSIIERSSLESPLTLTVISNSYRKYLDVSRSWQIPMCYIPWRYATFSNALRMHDVAIFPISKNPFTLVKSMNRPATALMAGLGVIADAIPSYEELRQFVFLDDWESGLQNYNLRMPQEIERINAAQEYLQRAYSTESLLNKWMTVLLS